MDYKLISEREKTGLTVDEMAARIGLSADRLCSIEINPLVARDFEIVRMCEFYNCSADWLLGVSDRRRPSR